MWVLLAILAIIVLSVAASGSTLSFPSQGLLERGSNVNETGVNVYSSDGTVTGATITNDPNTWPGDDKLWNICAAIAFAEGYNIGSGTAPYDLNNPGDLGPGDEGGEQTAGGAQWHGGSNIIVFSQAEGGWRALRNKFQHIISGTSTVYHVTDTWQQVAGKYAGNSAAWLTNVTGYLGVETTSTPAQYVNS